MDFRIPRKRGYEEFFLKDCPFHAVVPIKFNAFKYCTVFNPFFLYPLKTSENHKFSYVFRGYRKRPVA